MDSVKNFGRYEIKKEKRKDSNQTKQQKQTKHLQSYYIFSLHCKNFKLNM